VPAQREINQNLGPPRCAQSGFFYVSSVPCHQLSSSWVGEITHSNVWEPTHPVAKVLMIQWAHPPPIMWQCVELFSGSGNVSDYFRRAGKAVASFDKMLGGKAMDVAKVAGFLFGTQVPSVYM